MTTVLNGTTVPGGVTVRDLTKNGAKTQVAALDIGGAGAEVLLSQANPMPVASAALDAAADTVNSTITAAHPVIDTRAVLFAISPQGTYGNIERTTGGNLKVAVEEFDAPLPAGTNTLGSVRLTSGTVNAGVEPFGALNVNNGFQTLFYDAWSVSPIDTTDKWTVTGTAPTIANGNMTMASTLLTYNAIRTKDTIRANVGFTLVRNGITLESATATGCGRFWGLGTPATTPAADRLAQDGIGYEIDQATGSLLAVTYAAGVRTTIATLTRPTDGLTHAYGCYFRVTQAYWILDGVQVAAQSFPNIVQPELPALIVRQNAALFGGTPVFTTIAHLTADTSRQSAAISDPVIGTRQARVGADGSLQVAGAVTPAAQTATTGAITTNTGAVAIQTNRASNLTITMVAAALSGHNASFEFSNNSTNGTDGTWYALQAVRTNANTIESATGVLAATPTYGWECSCNGYNWVRVRATAHTAGTATYTIQPAPFATEPIPAAQVSGTQPVSGTVTATVTGGTFLPVTPTTGFVNSAATTNATSVKTTAGTVWSVVCSNTNAAARYVKLYNLAAAPTVGTSVPVLTIAVPPNDTRIIDGGSNGIRFGTGIALAITAGAADADATVVGAGEVKVATSYT